MCIRDSNTTVLPYVVKYVYVLHITRALILIRFGNWSLKVFNNYDSTIKKLSQTHQQIVIRANVILYSLVLKVVMVNVYSILANN